MTTETKTNRLAIGAMKSAFGDTLIAARDANVTAIITGAAYLVMSCHPGFPRDAADPVRPVGVVQDEIKELGEKYLAKGKSAKYQLAADALMLGRAVIARFKPSSADKVDGEVPDLFRRMSEAATGAEAAAILREAVGAWYGIDTLANVSRMMEAVKGAPKAKSDKPKNGEVKQVPLAGLAPDTGALPAPSDYPEDTPAPGPFGLAEARKVISPAIAKLVKAGDVGALRDLAADVEAAIAQILAAQAPAQQQAA